MEPVSDGTLLSFLARGGWAMLPLVLCSVIALAVIIEKVLWGPRLEKVMPASLADQILGLVRGRQYEQAAQLSRMSNTPFARIVLAILTHASHPRAEIMDAVQSVGRREAAVLQKHLGALATVAAVGPLLGLLGTVVGMISMFSALSLQGVAGSAAQVSAGISEALIATATGLSVAVPSLVFYRFFLYHSRSIISQMEAVAFEIVDELSMQKHQSASSQQVVNLHEIHR